MAKLKGEGGVEMLQFLMSLPSPPDVLDTLRAYFPSLPASSLQGLTNELFRCCLPPLIRIAPFMPSCICIIHANPLAAAQNTM